MKTHIKLLYQFYSFLQIPATKKPLININKQVVVINSISGFASDRFGRRRIITILSIIHVVTSFLTFVSSYLTSTSVSYPFLVTVRFFVGGSAHAVWTSTFVIASEICVEERRGLTGGVLNFGNLEPF